MRIKITSEKLAVICVMSVFYLTQGCANNRIESSPSLVSRSEEAHVVSGRILMPDGSTPLALTQIALVDRRVPKLSLTLSRSARFAVSRTDEQGRFSFKVKTAPSFDEAMQEDELGVVILSEQGGNYISLLAINSKAYQEYVLTSMSQFRANN